MEWVNLTQMIIISTMWARILRNGVAIIVNKRVQNAILGCNLKNDRMIHFQAKSFNITVTQVYALTSNAEQVKLNTSMKTNKTF